MSIKIRQQKAEERINNFDEVNLGYSKEEALQEANRCLQCPKPFCVTGCPAKINIPAFIKHIREDNVDEAVKVLQESNSLPAVCGRVCPQEEQCEGKCILKKDPIKIGYLERYAADNGSFRAKERPEATGKNIAVVGSGPAGLTCAADLSLMGHSVVIFEALHKAGGVLGYGIPEFRLPKKIVQEEVDYIKELGVEIKLNAIVGKTFEIKELLDDFDAVFISSGAGLPHFMNIPGENLVGVYSANEFLTRVNLMKAYKFPEYKTPVKKGSNVVVIGGGNVAVDAARVVKRLGGKVSLVYRRTEAEMPARDEEIEHMKEEDVELRILTNPLKIIGDKKVEAVECLKMELGEPDDSGRRRPVPVDGSEFQIGADLVIIAIGQSPNPLIGASTKDLKTGRKNTIDVDDKYMTSIDGVFAAGDAISGAATVIKAIGDAKKAAAEIDRYVKNK